MATAKPPAQTRTNRPRTTTRPSDVVAPPPSPSPPTTPLSRFTSLPEGRNPNRHTERGLRMLEDAIQQDGYVAPMTATADGTVIDGNARLDTVAHALPADPIVIEHDGTRPIIAVRTDIPNADDPRAQRIIVGANRIGEVDLDWDAEVLKRMQGEGVDLSRLWDAAALDAMLGVEQIEGLTDPEEIPEERPTSIVRGDMFVMGTHRLLCGDCRVDADVTRLVGDEHIAVAVTSPPYAQQRDYDEASGFIGIPIDEYVAWWASVQEQVAAHLAPDGSFFLNIKEHCEDGQRVLYVKDLTLAHVRLWGWRFVDELVWVHGGTPKAVINRFKNGWEPIFHFTRGDHKFRPDAVMKHTVMPLPECGGKHPSAEDIQGGRGTISKMQGDGNKSRQLAAAITAGVARKSSRHEAFGRHRGQPGAGKAIFDNVTAKQTRKYAQLRDGEGQTFGDDTQGSGRVGGSWVSDDLLAYPSNVLSLGKNREALGHSAAFPLGLPEFCIKAYSDRGDVVYDPFSGSGTTLMAAEREGRSGLMMEISPTYCDIIIRRWEAYTGKRAEKV